MQKMKCKYCDSEDFYTKEKTMQGGNIHLGLYCVKCDKWQKWEKQDKDKNKDNDIYKKEYMANQDPTAAQINYIRNIVKYKGPIGSKLYASNLISKHKGRG